MVAVCGPQDQDTSIKRKRKKLDTKSAHPWLKRHIQNPHVLAVLKNRCIDPQQLDYRLYSLLSRVRVRIRLSN